MANGNSFISKEDVLGIFEAFFDQLVTSFRSSEISSEELGIVLENFRCVYKELGDGKRLDNITHKELMDSRVIRRIWPELPL